MFGLGPILPTVKKYVAQSQMTPEQKNRFLRAKEEADKAGFDRDAKGEWFALRLYLFAEKELVKKGEGK